MTLKQITAIAVLAGALAPMGATAQTESEIHARAKARQEATDKHHHVKAKLVAGSAAGGAVTGAMVGGPVGAVVGAGIGAGGGLVANKIRKHHGIKTKEKQMER